MCSACDEGITISITHTLVEKHPPKNVCPCRTGMSAHGTHFQVPVFSNSAFCDRYGDTFCVPTATTLGLTFVQNRFLMVVLYTPASALCGYSSLTNLRNASNERTTFSVSMQ